MNTVETNNRDNNTYFRIVLAVVSGIVIAAMILSSCKTPARMLGKFDNLASKCAGKKKLDTVPEHWAMTKFPVKVTTVAGKPMYLPGKKVVTQVPGKTVYVNCDSLKEAGAETQQVAVPCPPSTHTVVTDTIRIHDVQTVLDTRESNLLRARLTGAMDEASKQKLKADHMKDRANALTWWVVGLGVVCLILLLLLIGGLTGRISHPAAWGR